MNELKLVFLDDEDDTVLIDFSTSDEEIIRDASSRETTVQKIITISLNDVDYGLIMKTIDVLERVNNIDSARRRQHCKIKELRLLFDIYHPLTSPAVLTLLIPTIIARAMREAQAPTETIQ